RLGNCIRVIHRVAPQSQWKMGKNSHSIRRWSLPNNWTLTYTDGPGQDDIVVRIIGAATTNQGTAKLLFSHWEANIDDDWEINPNKLLWEYTGLGFNSNVYILAAVADEDVAPLLAGFYSATSSVPNSGHQTGNLIAEFSKELCELKDHDCLGPPQIIPVTQADWNKVALGGQ